MTLEWMQKLITLRRFNKIIRWDDILRYLNLIWMQYNLQAKRLNCRSLLAIKPSNVFPDNLLLFIFRAI